MQHRMAYQGEYFVERYGAQAAEAHAAGAADAEAGVPVGLAPTPRAWPATTRGSRCTGWSTGRTLGGLRIYGEDNRLEREQALRLWTHGSAWFSNEEDTKGRLAVGQFADFAVLSADFFSVEDEAIKDITSV